MEFNFPLNLCFKNEITKIGSRLLPEGFFGERREVQECINRINVIMTTIGESSAKAQSLQKVITSGDRLRNSDHTVYMLVDLEGGSKGYGTVQGMLKVGVKHLYLFDSSGNNREVNANCILDFYVHESKQRLGLGKKIFDFMLREEGVEPKHMAIDKPSPKLLSFMHKHYGLQTIIPQMNNFVLYEGFFDNRHDRALQHGINKMAAGISSSMCRDLSGGIGTYDEQPPASPRQQPGTPSGIDSSAPYGRHAAHHPVSTMGLILQNQPPTQAATPAASRAESVGPSTPEPQVEEPEAEVAAQEAEPEPEPDVVAPIEDLSLDEADKTADEELPDPMMPCKVQAGNAPHLDLKFYHSSLW